MNAAFNPRMTSRVNVPANIELSTATKAELPDIFGALELDSRSAVKVIADWFLHVTFVVNRGAAFCRGTKLPSESNASSFTDKLPSARRVMPVILIRETKVELSFATPRKYELRVVDLFNSGPVDTPWAIASFPISNIEQDRASKLIVRSAAAW